MFMNKKEIQITEGKNNDDNIWLINIPILSISCPYSGHLISNSVPFAELMKDKCHHPMNVKWMFWIYPKCEKESCPIKVEK